MFQPVDSLAFIQCISPVVPFTGVGYSYYFSDIIIYLYLFDKILTLEAGNKGKCKQKMIGAQAIHSDILWTVVIFQISSSSLVIWYNQRSTKTQIYLPQLARKAYVSVI